MPMDMAKIKTDMAAEMGCVYYPYGKPVVGRDGTPLGVFQFVKLVTLQEFDEDGNPVTVVQEIPADKVMKTMLKSINALTSASEGPELNILPTVVGGSIPGPCAGQIPAGQWMNVLPG